MQESNFSSMPNDMLDKNGKSNPKSYWKLVKKLMGNCKHSPNIPPLQKLDSGEYVINNEDKANILNNFFCSITEIENSTVLTPPIFMIAQVIE
jgi:DNA/RNA endonuclease G (NUC1)